MGLDLIHRIEIFEVDKWVLVEDDIEINRWYRFYAVLCGVRNYEQPIVEKFLSNNRGLPRDVSPEVLELANEDCYFGVKAGIPSTVFGWATLQEIIEFDWPEEMTEYVQEELIAGMRRISGKAPIHIRMLFWFT